MNRILLLGAGKIGQMIARMLSSEGYSILVGDINADAFSGLDQHDNIETRVIDVTDENQLIKDMVGCDAVISALCFEYNAGVARAALGAGISYFDLTEDNATTAAVREISESAGKDQIFMPQCGLAPGFVSVSAHHLTKQFDEIYTAHMRVGALPKFPTNALKYNLTWSTDGLINEYCNLCDAIVDGDRMQVLPLQGLEYFSLDGVRYEAFNTSGGLGTLCETLEGRVQELNYKTVRYMGHRELMTFVLDELKLRNKKELLRDILEGSIPMTLQDVVIVFCTVTGMQNGKLMQVSDARKIYSRTMYGRLWSAIQITTASGICTAVDLHFGGSLPNSGFVKQEAINFDEFISNKFGCNYAIKEGA